jgi:hypothetical protein
MTGLGICPGLQLLVRRACGVRILHHQVWSL